MFPCTFCTKFLGHSFKRLLQHIKFIHSHEPNFSITRSDCSRSFRKFASWTHIQCRLFAVANSTWKKLHVQCKYGLLQQKTLNNVLSNVFTLMSTSLLLESCYILKDCRTAEFALGVFLLHRLTYSQITQNKVLIYSVCLAINFSHSFV